MTPYFFGYGSLVNENTHAYPDTRPARLRGWRRAWVRTDARDIVFLTAVSDPASTIDGLIAAVPGADWAALDAREYGYARHASGDAVLHDILPAPEIAHYAIPPDSNRPSGEQVILLSYLDVVVQGFARIYGIDGVTRFFETTDNWHIPILDDRAAPRYPRHQALTDDERALVDHHLDRLSAIIA
ncbi:gamma-glutamylcyclotransferase family protein [Sulfitobacter aestuarii]|uniref:Gamma-glutamylcyclotransferase family protein n=1 Tax=Sulfitobacter aestuarii TaxID=2161676 RepID=A0ABW5U464_9RHOB